jgi:hypothetical protein
VPASSGLEIERYIMDSEDIGIFWTHEGTGILLTCQGTVIFWTFKGVRIFWTLKILWLILNPL